MIQPKAISGWANGLTRSLGSSDRRGRRYYYSGLDLNSFTVTADFAIDGAKTGDNLASRFGDRSDGVRELLLSRPINSLARGTLTVAVKDRQGNTSRVERTFSVGKSARQ